jgi:penicillin-binding protein 1A
MAYDQRHGYRGPEAFIQLPADEDERDDAIDEVLRKHPSSDKLQAAVVTEVSSKVIKAELANGDTAVVDGDGLKFAANALQAKAKSSLKIVPGAVIRVIQDTKKRWSISQLPEVEGAYVALNAETGAYRALIGGFDFNRKKFNHVTSAWRQPGSSIKPFIYSAALEKGFSPATLINDVQLSATTGTCCAGTHVMTMANMMAPSACVRRWHNRKTWSLCAYSKPSVSILRITGCRVLALIKKSIRMI